MKAKRIKVTLAIIILILVALSLFVFTQSKNDSIELGMSVNDLMSVIEKNEFKYEINGNKEEPIIFIHNIVINNVDGNVYCHIQDDKISRMSFSSDTDSLNDKINILSNYLENLYGKPTYNEELSTALNIRHYSYHKNNIIITFEYPANSNSPQNNIGITWSYNNK